MAQVVGVPKREPCQKCGNPVFLAERLIIGKSLYHRTCLRCARCDSQLTLGSFYETEIDGEFCCETCPDEEKKIQISQRLSGDQVDDIDRTSESRQSFSDKLTMFQPVGKGFLQKSVSDEEKSKSLKRLSEMYSKNGQESNTEPLKTQSVASDSDSENSSSLDSDGDEEEDDDKPPVPITKPPSLTTSDESDTDIRPPLPSTKPPPIASKLNVLQKIQAGNSKFNNNNNNSNRFVLASASKASNNNGTVITAKPSHETSVNEDHHQQHNLDAMPITESQLSHLNSSINDTTTFLSNVKNLDDKISFNRNAESSTSPTNDVNVFAQSPINKEINKNLNLNNIVKLNDNTMPSDALNSFTNVTKEENNYDANSEEQKVEEKHEKQRVEEKLNGKEINDRLQTSISDSNESNIINRDNLNDSNNDNIDINSANVERRQVNNNSNNNRNSNMVRSRLSQFEALLQTEPQRSDSNRNSIKSFNHSKFNTISTNNSNNASKPIETTHQTNESSSEENNHSSIDNNDINNFNELTITADNDNKVPMDDQLMFNKNIETIENDNNDNKNLNTEQSEIERNLSYHTDEMESNAQQQPTSVDNKPVPVKRVTKDASCIENDTLTPPTPLKRRSKIAATALPSSSASASNDQLNIDKNKITYNKINEEVSPKKVFETVAGEPVRKIEEKKDEKIKYPESLNPFGDDDDEEEPVTMRNKNQQFSDASKQSKAKDTSNPFDSSDDEIELLRDTSSGSKVNHSKLAKQR